MEFSERFIRELEAEFPHVYEWQDPPGTVYEEHSHKGKVSLRVTDGAITFNFSGEEKIVNPGERIDIQSDQPHSAVVGPEGCIMIVGEEIEGDS